MGARAVRALGLLRSARAAGDLDLAGDDARRPGDGAGQRARDARPERSAGAGIRAREPRQPGDLGRELGLGADPRGVRVAHDRGARVLAREHLRRAHRLHRDRHRARPAQGRGRDDRPSDSRDRGASDRERERRAAAPGARRQPEAAPHRRQGRLPLAPLADRGRGERVRIGRRRDRRDPARSARVPPPGPRARPRPWHAGGGLGGPGRRRRGAAALAPVTRARVGALDAVLTTAVAVAIALLAAKTKSFWGDEIRSLEFATLSVGRGLAEIAADCHPPAYFLLLRLWVDVFGASELALRLFQGLQGSALLLAALAVFRSLMPERR